VALFETIIKPYIILFLNIQYISNSLVLVFKKQKKYCIIFIITLRCLGTLLLVVKLNRNGYNAGFFAVAGITGGEKSLKYFTVNGLFYYCDRLTYISYSFPNLLL
jgi:hypothetical protein